MQSKLHGAIRMTYKFVATYGRVSETILAIFFGNIILNLLPTIFIWLLIA